MARYVALFIIGMLFALMSTNAFACGDKESYSSLDGGVYGSDIDKMNNIEDTQELKQKTDKEMAEELKADETVEMSAGGFIDTIKSWFANIF